MSILSTISHFLHRLCKRRITMSAIDTTALSAEIDRLAANVATASAELSAATANAAQVDQLKAELSTAQADLATAQSDLAASQAAVTDLTAKLKAADDALAAVLPAPAPAA